MTEERDAQVPEEVSRRYRALGAESPPPALDAAILAAARRPARSATRRWAVPLSLAAVVVLSVTVTLNIQREAPDLQYAEAPAGKRPPAAAPEVPAKKEEPKVAQAEQAPAVTARAPAAVEPDRRTGPAPQRPFAADPPPVAAAAPPPPMAAPAPAAPAAAQEPALASRQESAAAAGATMSRSMEERATRDQAREDSPRAAAADSQRARAAMAKRVLPPEEELERIAQLRKEGRHDEADKALADFRKRLPDFRIPEAMLERVERR